MELQIFGECEDMRASVVKNKLTKREREITEYLAWGATKKEVAALLCISERTVENHTRNIYDKTGCTKINQLSAWWFCRQYHIPLTLSPFYRKSLTVIVLIIYAFGSVSNISDHQNLRIGTTRTISRSRSARRRNEETYIYVA